MVEARGLAVPPAAAAPAAAIAAPKTGWWPRGWKPRGGAGRVRGRGVVHRAAAIRGRGRMALLVRGRRRAIRTPLLNPLSVVPLSDGAMCLLVGVGWMRPMWRARWRPVMQLVTGMPVLEHKEQTWTRERAVIDREETRKPRRRQRAPGFVLRLAKPRRRRRRRSLFAGWWRRKKKRRCAAAGSATAVSVDGDACAFFPFVVNVRSAADDPTA